MFACNLEDLDWQEWHEGHSWAANARAFVGVGAKETTPVVVGRVDSAGAGVGDADVAAGEVVEVEVNLCGRVNDDVCIFIGDGVSADYGARDRRAAHAAVEIDTGLAGSRRISE